MIHHRPVTPILDFLSDVFVAARKARRAFKAARVQRKLDELHMQRKYPQNRRVSPNQDDV